MIPLRFFRDKTSVYVNNPNGITKKMTIEEFEAMLNGTGGTGGGGALLVHELYNEEDDYTYLDKSFSDITNAAKEGPVIIISTYEDEDVTMVNSFYMTYVGIASNGVSKIVMTVGAVESDNTSNVVTTIYKEEDDILKFNSNSYMPLPAYTFSINSNKISAGPSTIFRYIKGGNNCYFSDIGAGTNNEENYTVVEYGKTGTTYYLKLSDGNTYTGLLNDDEMTKVTT